MGWLVRIALASACSLMGTPFASALSGSVLQTPLSKNGVQAYSPQTLLRTTIDSRWFASGGYLPVRVRVEAKASSVVDRSVEVSLHLLSSARGRRLSGQLPADAELTARRMVTLPARETEAIATILCPCVDLCDLLVVGFAVDGVDDPALKGAIALATPGGRNGAALHVLRPGVSAFPAGGLSQQTLAIGSRRNSWVALEELTTESLDEWRAYTAADVIAISVEELRRIAEEEPEVLKPIRRWLLAGGTLWVERAEPAGAATMEDDTLPEIDRLLGLEGWRVGAVGEESQETPPQDDSEDEQNAEETPADPEPPGGAEGATAEEVTPSEGENAPVREPPLVMLDSNPGWGYYPVPRRRPSRAAPGANRDASPLEQLMQTLRSASALGAIDSRSWYAQREAGFGRVLAFRQSVRSIPNDLRTPAGSSLASSWRRRDWSQRHGVEVGGKSAEFGNLLIPDVGVAPVNEFQVLITLFVLMVGPLNYWLLWRRRQLHLLVITAPLGAMAVTLGLVAYAAVSDGFGVKARARSVTILDQSSGEAASWSRVTHYAATAPADPAVIPDDTAVYPINAAWEGAFNPTAPTRTLDWSSEGQRLTAGWFPTRTVVQHLMVRSRETEARLAFSGSGGARRVVNQLGASLVLLLVRDESGDWLTAEAVSAGEEAALDPILYREATLKLRLLAVENEPAFPIGAGRAIEQTLDRLGRSSEVRRMQRTLSTVSLEGNLGARVFDRLAGLTGGATLDVPPRTYVAVTDRAVETPLGWEGVDEVGSFHVTVGRW